MLRCPACGSVRSRVVHTQDCSDGCHRYRTCTACKASFGTTEIVVESTKMVIVLPAGSSAFKRFLLGLMEIWDGK